MLKTCHGLGYLSRFVFHKAEIRPKLWHGRFLCDCFSIRLGSFRKISSCLSTRGFSQGRLNYLVVILRSATPPAAKIVSGIAVPSARSTIHRIGPLISYLHRTLHLSRSLRA